MPARSVLAAPACLTSIEAASIWMQYLTALAIIEIAHATVGDFVIIRAASSSVGLAAIQLANWAGATPIAATRRSTKAEALSAHGAKHVIATEETDLVAEVMKITNGKGARIVFDPVGGPYVDTLAQAMAVDGTLFIYGGLSANRRCIRTGPRRSRISASAAGSPRRSGTTPNDLRARRN